MGLLLVAATAAAVMHWPLYLCLIMRIGEEVHRPEIMPTNLNNDLIGLMMILVINSFVPNLNHQVLVYVRCNIFIALLLYL
jgi:hypothetical protein